MRHLRQHAKYLGVAAAFSLALAACGTDDTETPAQSQPTATAPADGETSTASPTGGETTDQAAGANPYLQAKEAANHVGNNGSAKALATGIAQAAGLEGDVNSKAAQTYAALSTTLQEHVYLAGLAVDAGVNFGLDSAEFEAATTALDENSVHLSEIVGSVSSPEKEQAFLELWRQHIGFFVDYAKGLATDDQALADEAQSNLDQYQQDAGAFFEDISGGAIPADAIVQSLEGHISTLNAAIEAAVAGDTTVFVELKEAATHVGESGSAKALAAGIAQATGMEGDIEAPAVQAYVTLSTLLEEHVYLSSATIKTAYATGLDSEATKAATNVLDQNTVELSELVGSVSSPEKEQAFLELWRQHIGFFVDYAKGLATDDQALADEAQSNLDQYQQDAGAFFEDISGGAIPADAVVGSLEGHIETLNGAIEALNQVING